MVSGWELAPEGDRDARGVPHDSWEAGLILSWALKSFGEDLRLKSGLAVL